MKKFLSIVLAVAVILTTVVLPVSSAGAANTVELTSISEGQVFTAGTTIYLSADATGLSNVKNIDFYANGDKLPGTIKGNSGAINWYAPFTGAYKITTKVNFVGGETVDGSEEVNIVVLPDEADMKLIASPEEMFNTRYDVLYFDEGEEPELVEEYGVFSKNTLKIIPPDEGGLVAEMHIDYSDKAISGYRGGRLLAFSPSIDNYGLRLKSYFIPEDAQAQGEVRNATSKGAFLAYHTFSRNTTALTYSDITVSTTDGNPSGAPIYLAGVFAPTLDFESRIATPTPDITSGATGICTGIEKYRINFDMAIIPDDTKAPVTIAKTSAAAIEGLTYEYGFNYIDVIIPQGALEPATEYTVTFDGSILKTYPGYNQTVNNGTFTFTTVGTDCDASTPLAKVSYPAANAEIAGDSAFAVKMAAPGPVASVKLYNAGTELTEITLEKMSSGEWSGVPTTALEAGSYSITAKCFDSLGNQIGDTSAAVAVDVIGKPEYFVKGIYDGAYIIKAEEPTRKITVVDAEYENTLSNVATNIQKIEIYKGSTLVKTLGAAENQYDLPVDVGNGQQLTVKIYDTMGNVTPKTYTYNVLSATKTQDSFFENFDTMTDYATEYGAYINDRQNTTNTATVTITDGKVSIYEPGSSAGRSDFYVNKNIKSSADDTTPGDANVLYYRYKVKHTAPGYNQKIYFGGVLLLDTKVEAISSTVERQEELIIDLNNNLAIIRIDGEEYKRVDITGKGNNKVYHQFFKETITFDDIYFANYESPKSFGVDPDVQTVYTNLSGDTLEVTTNANNTTTEEESVTNIIAVYDANGVLIATPVLDELLCPAGQETSETYTVDLVHGGVQGKTVRLFTWKSLWTLEPLGAWGE